MSPWSRANIVKRSLFVDHRDQPPVTKSLPAHANACEADALIRPEKRSRSHWTMVSIDTLVLVCVFFTQRYSLSLYCDNIAFEVLWEHDERVRHRTHTAGSNGLGTISWQYFPVINVPSSDLKGDERGPFLELWSGQFAQD
jgi:hypothetical protein